MENGSGARMTYFAGKVSCQRYRYWEVDPNSMASPSGSVLSSSASTRLICDMGRVISDFFFVQSRKLGTATWYSTTNGSRVVAGSVTFGSDTSPSSPDSWLMRLS